MRIIPFDSRDCRYKNPFGAVPEETQVQFIIRPHRRYGVTQALLLIHKDEETVQYPLVWIGMEEGCDIYTCNYIVKEPGLYWYGFLLLTGDCKHYIIRDAHGKGKISDHPGSCWQLTVYHKDFTVPEWFAGGILYQIFPDRFFRHEDVIDHIPSDRVIRKDWGGLPDYEALDRQINMNKEYFGGNLKGITDKLDYLEGLGVTALYLNPIFEAHSNHRYDTADYMHIDPLLGTEEDFISLCREARIRGIHILLDGVFSHTGADSIYFNKYGRYAEKGAYQSKDSVYYEWFSFTDWPEGYRSWWGIDSLPETNEACSEFQDYLFAEDGVLAHWLRAGADGWRLDVVDELPTFFVRQLRRAVKKEKPEAILIGEVWEDASNKVSYGQQRHYLEGEELDSVMNYPLTEGIIRYMKERDASILNEAIMTILENYPKPVIDVLMNILGTHDTVRILTRLRGDEGWNRDRHWQAHTQLSEAERRKGLREVGIAATILYLLPGVPCIYYGDEIGLEGYRDPFNRGCFLWENTDCWLTDWYRKLGTTRRKHVAVLKSGKYMPVTIDQGFYAFLRKGDKYSLLCAVNMGEDARALDTRFEHKKLTLIMSLDENNRTQRLMIPPTSCKIYKVYH